MPEGAAGGEVEKKEEQWIVVPPELKALPSKLLPQFSDLRPQPGGQQHLGVTVQTTPEEGKNMCERKRKRDKLLLSGCHENIYFVHKCVSVLK